MESGASEIVKKRNPDNFALFFLWGFKNQGPDLKNYFSPTLETNQGPN